MCVWTAFYWHVLPLSGIVARPFPDEAVPVIHKLRGMLPESGTYRFPQVDPRADSPAERAAAQELFQRRREQGPQWHLFYRRDGAGHSIAWTVVLTAVQSFIASLLAAGLLVLAGPVLNSYGKRVGLVALAALMAVALVDMADPILWGHPAAFHAATGAYHATTGIVMGLVLGAIVKPDVEML